MSKICQTCCVRNRSNGLCQVTHKLCLNSIKGLTHLAKQAKFKFTLIRLASQANRLKLDPPTHFADPN
jgi:hypothetical protein